MTGPLRFFDCNTFIGLPATGLPGGGVSAEGLLAAMDRSGIERALVWHVAQRDADPLVGNELLTSAIAGRDRLAGCWTLLPPQTGEAGTAEEFLAAAAGAGVKALRAFPEEDCYLLRAEVLGGLLERMIAAHMPLVLSIHKSVGWPAVYDLLRDLPALTVICADLHCWGSDRYFRPLIERYPNVYVEISAVLLDGGIEDFVARYGPERLLFGTNFPAAYQGGMMLALARAEIAEAAKAAIAAGNIERLLGEVRP